jgi:hypothetical protein
MPISESKLRALVSFHGAHYCSFKHYDRSAPAASSKDVILDFGDSSYTLPESVLHYINDFKVHHWSIGWKPPQHFIDKILQGGVINGPDIHLQKKNSYHIGYLQQGRGNQKKIIVDTHGGDEELDQGRATPATFGPVPPEFVERLQVIIRHILMKNVSVLQIMLGRAQKGDDVLELPPIVCEHKMAETSAPNPPIDTEKKWGNYSIFSSAKDYQKLQIDDDYPKSKWCCC